MIADRDLLAVAHETIALPGEVGRGESVLFCAPIIKSAICIRRVAMIRQASSPARRVSSGATSHADTASVRCPSICATPHDVACMELPWEGCSSWNCIEERHVS